MAFAVAHKLGIGTPEPTVVTVGHEKIVDPNIQNAVVFPAT